jgi:type IV secretion system protein VirD4
MEIRKGLQFEVRDTQNVAITLIDPDGEKQKSDHWDRAGYDLLTGAILHVLYAENDKTLSGVTKFLSDPNRTIYETLTAMLKTRHLGDKPHPTIASLARSMLNKSPNELSGVQSTILGYLSLYRDPTVAHITRACDFKVLDLVNADKPVSLYIVVSPADISRTAPLVRLLLNMIGSRLAEVPLRPGINNSPYKHKLLLLMDELPAFGYMQFYEKALGYIAGYGIRSMLIAQSLAQIEKLYGKKNALLEACHILAFFTPNPKDVDGAKEISEILGDTTRERRNSMFSGGRLAIWLRNVTVSAQEMGRKLLTPGEILRLDKDKIILIVSRLYPMLINKVRYYEDPLFSSRQLPDIPTDGTYKDYPQSKESEWANCIVSYVPEDDEEEDNTGAAATVSIVLAGKEDDKNTEQKGQEEHTVDNTLAPENEPALSPQQQLQMQQSQQRVEDRRHDHHHHKHDKDDKGKGISDGIVW